MIPCMLNDDLMLSLKLLFFNPLHLFDERFLPFFSSILKKIIDFFVFFALYSLSYLFHVCGIWSLFPWLRVDKVKLYMKKTLVSFIATFNLFLLVRLMILPCMSVSKHHLLYIDFHHFHYLSLGSGHHLIFVRENLMLYW